MKYKTEFIETRLGKPLPIEEVIDSLYEKELSNDEFWRTMSYLLNHAYLTKDDMIQKECQRAKMERFGKPFPQAVIQEVAPDYNLPAQPTPNLRSNIHTTFVERVKDIICQAAKKNNQTITSIARNNPHQYIFYINADAFCLAIDDIEKNHEKKLSDFLGGNLNNVQANVVCNFLGYVIKKYIINRNDIEFKHLLFAFSKFYNEDTANSRLTEEHEWTDGQKVFLGLFEGLLINYSKNKTNNAE